MQNLTNNMMSDFINSHLQLIDTNKSLLCLGKGKDGAEAIFFAELGLQIEVLDDSAEVLCELMRKAQEIYKDIAIRHTFITYWTPCENCYGTIVSAFFQIAKEEQTIMFEKIYTSLSKGGLFIGEFFSESQPHYKSGGPIEEDRLYGLKNTSDNIKNLPFVVHKLSQEVIFLKDGKKASVIRIILEKK